MCGARADLLKRGETHTFAIYFFQGLSVLHSGTILLSSKLCYTFEEKKFFFSLDSFMKKSNSKLSKN